MICIYKITSPTGKIYIGQTCSFKRRFNSYKNLKCLQQPKLYNSFLKHGFENHTFKILLECKKEELNHFENKFIVQYGSNINGLNCTSGGNKCIFNQETKNKMSNSAKGRVSPMKGRIQSDSAKLKMSISKIGKTPWNKGVPMKKSSKELMIKNRKGKKHSEETKTKMSLTRKGKVNQRKIIDEKTGEIFKSVGDAANYANLKYTTLLEMLKGRNRNKTNLKYF